MHRLPLSDMHAAAARRIFEHGAGVLLLPVAPRGLSSAEETDLWQADRLEEITDALSSVGRFAVLNADGVQMLPPIDCPAPAAGTTVYIGEAWGEATTGTVYRASGGQRSPAGRWRPAHQMPAGAARTVLLVMGRRAMRLNDITQAIAERAGMPAGGMGCYRMLHGGAAPAHIALRDWWLHWTGIHWFARSWCWAIEVRKCASALVGACRGADAGSARVGSEVFDE